MPDPSNLTPPVVTGSAVVGAVETCSQGTWNPQPNRWAYQWKRETAPASGIYANIGGQTASTYVQTNADLGLRRECEVTASIATATGNWQPGVNRQGGSFNPGSENYSNFQELIVGRQNVAAAVPVCDGTLAYMAMVDVNRTFNTGVDWATANANGWLLRDSSGNLLVNTGYPDNNVGDVGLPAYQQAWRQNVAAFLAQTGASGVFIDDVVAALSPPFSGIYPAKYPNQAAWQAAMASGMAAVGPYLKALGYRVIPNAGKFVPGDGGSDDGSLTAAWWQQLAPYVTGFVNELWMQNGANLSQVRTLGGAYYQHWDGWEALTGIAQAAGVGCYPLMYGEANSPEIRYGLASFLLDWDGSSGGFIISSGGNPNGTWMNDPGAPLGAKSFGGGVWTRVFTNLTVTVNPTAGTATIT